MMKVIITGSLGQLGYELQKTAPTDIELIAVDRDELDISHENQVQAFLEKEKPNWLINAAAYTQVDKAEQEHKVAYQVNANGPENLAKSCKLLDTKMLQVSTDFVFDGEQGHPYEVDSVPNPLNVYGASKQKGDEAVLSVLGDEALILRTSWVYSAHGNNFVKSMLKFMEEKEELNIVVDQVGTPTWACGLAKAIWVMMQKGLTGIYHWSDSGVASWYDFAIAIQREALDLGLISKQIPIRPIPSTSYPLPATRPAYSVLGKQKTVGSIDYVADHWQTSLISMLTELKQE